MPRAVLKDSVPHPEPVHSAIYTVIVLGSVAAFAEDSEPVRSIVGSKCLRCRFSDGNVLTVGAKQLCCTEVLFRQSLPMSDVPAGRLTRMRVSKFERRLRLQSHEV